MIQLINDYEDEKISSTEAISEFNKLSNQSIDEYILENYWASEDLEQFVERHAIEEIEDWKGIDDARAVALIEETQQRIDSDAIEGRNVRALEKRYGKPEGTLFEIIHENAPDTVLALLKKDNVIRL